MKNLVIGLFLLGTLLIAPNTSSAQAVETVSLIRCQNHVEDSSADGAFMYSSHVDIRFEKSLFDNTGRSGTGEFLNFDVEHIQLKDGELQQHFRAHLSPGPLAWARMSDEVFDIRFKIRGLTYLIRLNPKARWPQKPSLLFAYSTHPDYAVEKLTKVRCTRITVKK